MYIVQFNDGRTFKTGFKGEARFWAWLSFEACCCNVYAMGGSGYMLSPFDII